MSPLVFRCGLAFLLGALIAPSCLTALGSGKAKIFGVAYERTRNPFKFWLAVSLPFFAVCGLGWVLFLVAFPAS